MSIKKKQLSEALQTAYTSIPLVTSSNNGLMNKKLHSRTCYCDGKYAQVAKLGNGGITGLISLFKDHWMNVACIFVQCFNRTNIGVYAKKIALKDTPNVKLYYKVTDGYMYLYTEADTYFCHNLTILGSMSRNDSDVNDSDLTACPITSIPEDAIEVAIN